MNKTKFWFFLNKKGVLSVASLLKSDFFDKNCHLHSQKQKMWKHAANIQKVYNQLNLFLLQECKYEFWLK